MSGDNVCLNDSVAPEKARMLHQFAQQFVGTRLWIQLILNVVYGEQTKIYLCFKTVTDETSEVVPFDCLINPWLTWCCIAMTLKIVIVQQNRYFVIRQCKQKIAKLTNGLKN